MKLLRQCEKDFKVSRITSTQSDVYELHFKNHPSIRIMFISTEIKLNLVTERDDFLDTVIKSLRTNSKSLGVLIGMRGSHTAASKLSNCAICGKLLKGEAHDGVLVCTKCFDHLKQIKATLKSTYDLLNF